MGITTKTKEVAQAVEDTSIAKTVSPQMVKLAEAVGIKETEQVSTDLALAFQGRKESKGDKEVGSGIIRAAFLHAAEMHLEKEVLQKSYLQLDEVKSVVSRIIRLAFPETPEASAELDKCIASNAKQSNPFKRIGIKTLRRVAGGQQTFAEVIEGKALAKKNRKARTPDGTKAKTPAEARKLLTTAITLALQGYVGNDRCTLAESDAIYADARAKRAAELAK